MTQAGESVAVIPIEDLQEDHWVQVEYQYASGYPVKGWFTAVDGEGREWRGKLNDKGQACLNGLPPGSVDFELLPADNIDGQLENIRTSIKKILDAIVAAEKAEAAQIDQQLQQQSTMGQAGSYGKAIAVGFWDGAVGLLTFATDVIIKAAEIAVYVSPFERMNNLLSASYRSYQSGELTREKWLQSIADNMADEEFKDIAGILGFDVRSLTPEKLAEIKALVTEAYEIVAFIRDDPESLDMLTQFGKDYAGAQSSLEWAEFAGGGIFEIVLAALLIAFTGGIGNAAQIAGKVRHLEKLRGLGNLFRRLGKALKRKKLNKKTRTGVDTKKEVKTELPDDKKLKTVPDKKLKQQEPDCFKKNSKGDPGEYDRQLKGQQDGLNDMTAQEYRDGRNAYSKTRASTSAVREEFQEKLVKDNLDSGMSIVKAEAEANATMKTLNALHNPDMYAGGKDIISDFGDAGVNKSIGSQWKSRISALDEAADDAIAQGMGDYKMNVNLKRCGK